MVVEGGGEGKVWNCRGGEETNDLLTLTHFLIPEADVVRVEVGMRGNEGWDSER